MLDHVGVIFLVIVFPDQSLRASHLASHLSFLPGDMVCKEHGFVLCATGQNFNMFNTERVSVGRTKDQISNSTHKTKTQQWTVRGGGMRMGAGVTRTHTRTLRMFRVCVCG